MLLVEVQGLLARYWCGFVRARLWGGWRAEEVFLAIVKNLLKDCPPCLDWRVSNHCGRVDGVGLCPPQWLPWGLAGARV